MSLILEPVEEGLHFCEPLYWENNKRVLDGESEVSVFKDLDNEKWNIKVGLEFVPVNCCPFCAAIL